MLPSVVETEKGNVSDHWQFVRTEYLLYCLNGWVVERNRLGNVVWQLNNQEVSTEATGQAENRLGD
jgi:hypothetical protein